MGCKQSEVKGGQPEERKQVEVEKKDTAEMERQSTERWAEIEKMEGGKARREPGKVGEKEAEVGEMGERQRETEGDRAIILTNSLRALLKGG